MSSGMVARAAWNDRFRKPSADTLVSEVGKSLVPAVELAREQLLAVSGVRESVSWQGVPWRWSLLYKHESIAGRAWVYLIPQPQRAIVVVPLTGEGVSALPLRRLLKPVRDGITHAKQVDGVRWAQWEVQSKAQIETLMKLAKIQLEICGAAANAELAVG
jgi:hypothetical protein